MDLSSVTIDIHSGKLVEWLLSRRHCQKSWQSAVVQVRERIAAALQDMPELDELADILSGTHVHYYQCQRVVQLLRTTEAASRTLLGGYTSQRMKDWMEVIRLYERDDLFLAEASQLLQRNVSYEIPALKRQIERAERTHLESLRKEHDQLSQAKELREKLSVLCNSLGVEPARGIRAQLINRAELDVPRKLAQVSEELQQLRSALNLYSAFNVFLSKTCSIGGVEEEQGKRICEERCPLTRHILDKGNTTTFEYLYGKAPNSVVPVDLMEHVKEDSASCEIKVADLDEINWGDEEAFSDVKCCGGSEFVEEIDGVNIDFDIRVEEDTEQPSGDIDWSDIEIIRHRDVAEAQPGLAALHNETDVARGHEARTLLDNITFREMLMNELCELDAFLDRFADELNCNSGASMLLMQSLLNAAPSVVQQTDANEAGRLLATTRKCAAMLNEPILRHLLLVRDTTGHYVTRLAAQVDSLSQQVERLERLAAASRRRSFEAKEEALATQPRLDLVRQRTRDLQAQIEASISAKYKGRQVHIIGEITTIG